MGYPVPESKPYNILDFLTRIDEQLEVVIGQLNRIIELLEVIAGRPVAVVERRALVTVTPPPQPVPAPGRQPQAVPSELTVVSKPVKVRRVEELSVEGGKYREYELGGRDVILLVTSADADVELFFDTRPTRGLHGVPVYQRGYIILHVKDYNKLYIYSPKENTKVRVVELTYADNT